MEWHDDLILILWCTVWMIGGGRMTAGIAAIPKVAVSSQIASWPVCCRRCSTCSTCSTCGTCGTCGTCAHDGWMDTTNCRSRPCSPDVRIHGMYTCACTDTYVLSECTDWCVTPSALTFWSAKSDEETSDGLDAQDTSCPPSVDSEVVPGGEQDPTQGRPRHSDLTSPLSERKTSQTVFINKMTRVCPPSNVHDELVRLHGQSGAV